MSRAGPSISNTASGNANPLKPRPRMLIGLSIVFVLWVAFLLTMYFTTVYPHRHVEVRPGDVSIEPAASTPA